MTEVNDAMLRAYLRGELAGDAMDAVDAALADNPALADRLEMLADQDDGDEDMLADMVRNAYAPIDAMPVPAALTAVVAEVSNAASNVVDFSAAAAARRLPRWGWPQMASMAASLAIGLFVGQAYLGGAGPGDALVVASADGTKLAPQVAAMLAEAPSGVKQQLAGLGEGQVVISFRDGDGQLCRQFQIAGSATITDAVSCRANGSWSVEAVATRDAGNGGVRTASGDAAAPVLAAVDAIIAGDVLVGADETAALVKK
ncbi:MAG: hypothetical protein HC788_13215 [Sphingopyxis sp.]|nr:hypothetical protein [Sphingopyxis sp.]